MRHLALAILLGAAVTVLVSATPLASWTSPGGGLTFEVTRAPDDDVPLDRLAASWRKRLREYDVTVVSPDGAPHRRLEVRVEGPTRAQADAIAGALTRPGTLAFLEVVNDTPASRMIFQAMREGTPGPVTADIDAWSVDATGEQHADYMLIGPSAEAIWARLEEVWAADESTWLAEHQSIAMERFLDEEGQSLVRTYVVDDRPLLTQDHVDAASVTWDPQLNRPEVLLELTPEGARLFGEATSALLGRKIAIVLDGWVVSAPVIHGAILGGTSNISMGGSRPERQQADAEALVSALRDRSELPPGLVATLTGASEANAAMTWALRIGAGVVTAVLMWVLAWFAARSGVSLARAPRRLSFVGSRRFAIATAVTIAVPAVMVLLERVPLPRLGRDAYNVAREQPEMLSIVSIGFAPVLIAYALVELVALLIPALRARRHRGPASRAPLERAALRLAVVLALVSGWLYATLLQSGNSGLVQMTDEGVVARAHMTLTLALGTLVLSTGAAVVTRWGLCNGWHVLIGTAAAFVVYRHAATTPAAVAIVAIVALGTFALVTVRHRGTRLPPGGALPVMVAPFVVIVLMLALVSEAKLVADAAVLAGKHQLWISLAAIAAAVAITGAWRQPWRAAAVVGAGGGLLALAAVLPDLATGVKLVTASALVTVTALDLLAGLRAHATIVSPITLAEVHDADRADQIADALTTADVPFELVGVHTQTLLPGVAPFAPVAVVVPAARRDDAARLAEPALRPGDVTPEQAAAAFA